MAVDMVVGTMTKCFNGEMQFPGITMPGLPNFALGTFMSTFAGISLALDFIPPSPTNLPSLPSLGLFTAPFLGAMNLPGLSGPTPPKFDPSGGLNLVFGTIQLIFKLFTGIFKSIISLSPKLPTLGLAIDLFKGIALDFNFPADLKIECIPKAIVGLITALLPL